ncbi:MAG TPA: CopD family protein [Rhizomicrobium sp.]|nr:CopD family protein [Rhizomicrobium sp.]
MILAPLRGLYYAATMLLFGDAVFGVLLRAKLAVIMPVRVWSLRWTALLVALVAGCLWLGMAAAQMAGAMNGQVLAETITATLFGQLFLARLAALVGMAPLLLFRRSGKTMAVLAAVALALPAATSHTALSSPAGFTLIGAILDATHLLAAGFWIGGLVVLAALFRRKEPNLGLALSLFSDWAMIAVLILIMSGLIDATSILLGSKGAPSLTYLAVLGAKLALVAAMLWLAAANRFKWLPRNAESAIAKNTIRELCLGLVVVLLAGALGQLQPLL